MLHHKQMVKEDNGWISMEETQIKQDLKLMQSSWLTTPQKGCKILLLTVKFRLQSRSKLKKTSNPRKVIYFHRDLRSQMIWIHRRETKLCLTQNLWVRQTRTETTRRQGTREVEIFSSLRTQAVNLWKITRKIKEIITNKIKLINLQVSSKSTHNSCRSSSKSTSRSLLLCKPRSSFRRAGWTQVAYRHSQFHQEVQTTKEIAHLLLPWVPRYSYLPDRKPISRSHHSSWIMSVAPNSSSSHSEWACKKQTNNLVAQTLAEAA